MAIGASLGRRFVEQNQPAVQFPFRCVACLARYLRMRPNQLEACLVVIEIGHPPPRIVMTGVTLRLLVPGPKLTGMNIFVAAGAVAGGIAKRGTAQAGGEGRRLVTQVAGDGAMAAGERKSGSRMVELREIA